MNPLLLFVRHLVMPRKSAADGNMQWTLSFDTNADRDAALALIDVALIEPVVRPPDSPAAITFSRGEETKTIPLK